MNKKVIRSNEDVALGDGDYTLADNAAWFTVKGFAIRVRDNGIELNGESGVIVDVYKDDKEDLAAPIRTIVVHDREIA